MLYLPIAEMPVNVLVVLLVSGMVGFVSGLVGVGGGFIMTPALIFMGIPAPVAVATGASHIAATSFSGMLSHASRRGVDWRMGLLLSIGGVIGGLLGVKLFQQLMQIGQIDLIITLLYVVFLAIIGALMLAESIALMRGRTAPAGRVFRRPARTIAHSLPFRLRFPRSGLYISVIPPLGARLRYRRAGGDHGRRRGLRADASDDLSVADAHERRHRHVAIPDPDGDGDGRRAAGGADADGGPRVGRASDAGRRGRRAIRGARRARGCAASIFAACWG